MRRLNPLQKEFTTTTVPALQAETFHPTNVVAAQVAIGFAMTAQNGIGTGNKPTGPEASAWVYRKRKPWPLSMAGTHKANDEKAFSQGAC